MGANQYSLNGGRLSHQQPEAVRAALRTQQEGGWWEDESLVSLPEKRRMRNYSFLSLSLSSLALTCFSSAFMTSIRPVLIDSLFFLTK